MIFGDKPAPQKLITPVIWRVPRVWVLEMDRIWRDDDLAEELVGERRGHPPEKKAE